MSALNPAAERRESWPERDRVRSPWWAGLRSRLLALMLVPLVPIVVLLLVQQPERQHEATASAAGATREVASVMAAWQLHNAQVLVRLIGALAQFPVVADGGPTCVRVLEMVGAVDPHIGGLWILTADGQSRCAVTSAPVPAAASALARSVLERGQVVATLLPDGLGTGQPVLMVAHPVASDGLIVAMMDITPTADDRPPPVLAPGGVVAVVEDDGDTAFLTGEPDAAVRNLTASVAAATLTNGRTGGGQLLTAPDGTRYFVGTEQFEVVSRAFTVVILMPRAVALSGADRSWFISLLVIGSVVTASVAIGWVSVSVFLSRFRPIIETTRRIADGDLGARVGAARGTAEVRSLGADIDRMAASLEQRTRALQASERRYRTLIDEFPGGAVLYFDRDLVFRFAGGASLETVGYQQAEVEGHTVQEVQQHDGSVVEHRYRAVLNGEVHTAESVKNGHVFESLPVPVRDEHGQVIAGMSILRDVTDQRRAAAAVRESQERLRLIIETMADGLMVRDRDGRYIEATGEIAGVVSTLTDVTARVEAERALRVSLERLARIIEMIA